MQFKPVVLVHQPQVEFRWLGHLFIKGLFDGEHYSILEKIDDTQTKLIHCENFSGLIASMLMKKIGANTQKGFEAMNLALKQKAELN